MRQLGGKPAYASEIVRTITKGILTVEFNSDHQNKDSLLANMQAMSIQLSNNVREIIQLNKQIGQTSHQISNNDEKIRFSEVKVVAEQLQSNSRVVEQLTKTLPD